MASKYIDADALEVVCFTDREGSSSDGVQWLLEYIDGLPSADVQPVRHGQWKMVDKGHIENSAECSVCGEWWAFGSEAEDFLFCPRCGAIMDGEQDR